MSRNFRAGVSASSGKLMSVIPETSNIGVKSKVDSQLGIVRSSTARGAAAGHSFN